MRIIEDKLSKKDLRFVCLYFADIYCDIKTMAEHYIDSLNEEDKQTVLTSFEKLNTSLEMIKNNFNIDVLNIDEEMGELLYLTILKQQNSDNETIFQKRYIEPFFNSATIVEEDCKHIANQIWQNSLTDVKDFDNTKYGLLVYKVTDKSVNDFKSYRNYLNDNRARRLSTSYITEKNNETFYEYKAHYGLVYGLNSKNFIGGCRYDAFTVENSENVVFCTNRDKRENNKKIYELFSDGTQKIYSGLDMEYASGYATKTITPKRVEERGHQKYYSEIVLDYLNSKPEAVFYFCYGNKFLTPCNLKEVKEIAEYYNVPVIALDKLKNKSIDMLNDFDMQEIATSFYFNIGTPNFNGLDIDYVENCMKYYDKIVEANPQTKVEFENVLDEIGCTLKQNDSTDCME